MSRAAAASKSAAQNSRCAMREMNRDGQDKQERQQGACGCVEASKILSVLGPQWFVEITAVRTPGKILWCNFELARELGFNVPSSNRMTAEFDRELIEALSYRILAAGEDACDRKTLTMYADKYGGDGVYPALGAGRAGFLPYGNLYVKGIGLTPLFKHNDPDDLVHAHGEVHLDDCLVEALFGEVNTNLFTKGSARVLAIIDQGRNFTFPNGIVVPTGLLVRAGTQYRPAHLLAKGLEGQGTLLEAFVNIARETGQVSTRRDAATGAEVPDIKATMLRLIEDHALTSAEQFRWRMVHGALSSSNMEMSGAMLDLATQTTQSRTAPIWVLDYPDSIFGREHIERAVQLGPIYRALVKSLSREQRKLFDAKSIDLVSEMSRAYTRHLELKLLGATGLKTEVAQRLQTDQPELVHRFTRTVTKMAELRNPGSVDAENHTVERISVFDVFTLLQRLPHKYFAHPAARQARHIRRYLSPIYRGNRFYIARCKERGEILMTEFEDVYRQLMNACEPLASEHYGDSESMRRSIESRAGFENRPLPFLYRIPLYKELSDTISTYRATGEAAILQAAIDNRIADSLRNVDALLSQGQVRRRPRGGVELEMRTINGVNYSITAWNGEPLACRLLVSIPVTREGTSYLTPLPDFPHLTRRQIQSLRYRFTIDDGANKGEVGAHLVKASDGGFVINFEGIGNLPVAGHLKGAFYLKEPCGLPNTNKNWSHQGYAFVVPDRQEFLSITKAHALKPARGRKLVAGEQPVRSMSESSSIR
jgi:hypothetical protein